MSTTGLKTTVPKIIEGVQQPDLAVLDQPIHGYTWKGIVVPFTTGIIKDVGLGTDFGKCTPNHLAYRGRVGTAFHLAARYLVVGRLDPDWADPVVQPYLDALLLFWKESGAEPIAAEVPLYSELHGFATTVDSVWMWNGKRTIVEYKTSETVSPAEEYQTWAQEIAWNEYFRDDQIEDRYALHLKKNGKYHPEPWNQRQAYNFTYLLWMFSERKKRGLPCHV